ncbi:MAG: SDR family NAD(P)-dependent oxidoreductase [Beijerinckiaceae bacterium]
MTQTALVTGAARGIGFALVQRLAQSGWNVHACARDASACEPVSNVAWHSLDVTDFAAVDALATYLRGTPVDLLVNNAGAGPRGGGALGSIDYAQWRKVLEINTLAPIKMIEAFAGHVAASQRKLVVSISSELGSGAAIDAHGLGGSGPWIHYRSSKGALNIAQRSIDAALKDHGITAFLVHPGWVVSSIGGPHAALTPEQSAAGIAETIESADASLHGAFVTFDGRRLAW